MTEEEFHQEVRLEYYKSGVQVTREIGIFALKTILTLNSGAFVVLLTFIGNSAEKSGFLVPLWNVKNGMFCFLIGIAVAFLVVADTYVASQQTTPYPTPDRKTDGWYTPIVVVLTGIAFVAFLAGVVIVISGVEATP